MSPRQSRRCLFKDEVAPADRALSTHLNFGVSARERSTFLCSRWVKSCEVQLVGGRGQRGGGGCRRRRDSLTHAAPRSPACGVAPSVACASCSARVVAFCGLPHRAPRPPRPPFYPFYHTTRPARRAVVASRHPRCCESVRQRLSTLAATAMESKLQMFLKERGHFDLLREFEAYCASPASPEPQPPPARQRAYPLTPTPTPDRVIQITLTSPRSGVEKLKMLPNQDEKRPLTQASDGSTYYHLTPSSKKPKKANIAKATAPAKSTRSIYDSPVSWREPSQPTTASQGAVDAGKTKAAAPATAKSVSDKADVTDPPSSAPRGPKPPPMFVQNKDRWTELRKRCAEKKIQISQARNSALGLKLQAKTVADFKNLQNLLVSYNFKFHTYSLKEEREIRVVLRGVPKEIPVDEVKEDLQAQNLPVQSVRRILNRSREPLDLVLVSGTAEANDKATKAAFFKIRSVCSLSGVKAEQPRKRALPGSAITASPTGIRPVIASILRAASNAWVTTARRNVRAIRTQTVHPPVFYANRRATRPTILDARVLLKDPLHPRRPCRAERPRVLSRPHLVTPEQQPDRVTPRPPQKTFQHPQTI
ncbi:Nucleic-acid-binding protein from transposon X-element [Eumeta japonica]|uniref:Nucleic-acid-binding protein from transposon X-element n=1 Tax=Eumeta variegata TaxID=151549 RepID=A0A4C1ZB74_EUMVA|nr:Nucleic-acid-binding protein from transposon X-element [Eumeta japonica]